MKPFVFEAPPLTQSEDGRILGEYLHRQFLKVQEAIDSDAFGVTWRGEWQEGQYCPYEMVTDEGWLAIPNKCTTDKPAPVAVGEEIYAIEIPGTPSWAQQSVNQTRLMIGTRYTWSYSGYLRSVRFYIPDDTVGFQVELWGVLDPESATPDYRNLVPAFTIELSDTEQWVEIPVGLMLIIAGKVFDIIAIFTPTTGDTSFTYEWDYDRKNGDPPSGEIWHQSGNNTDQMRVHQNDSGDVDRSTELNNIGVGSRIEMVASGYSWTVLSSSKTGSVYTFIVEPAERASAETSNFTFTYYSVLPIHYFEAAGHYTGYPGLRGFLSEVYDPDGLTLTDHAYGVDIKIQEAQISDDWSFLAYSG